MNKKMMFSAKFIGAVFIGLLLAGCEKPKTAVKVGYLPATNHAKFFIAKEQGFFEKEGLNVEMVEFVNSADGINAVIANKVDIGAFGTSAPLLHISHGANLKIVGGIMGEDASVITTSDNVEKIKKTSDLKGKKIATVRLATGDAIIRGALKQAGLSIKNDVEIFELKSPPAVIEAVKSGQVDVGVVWGPHDVRAEDQGLKVALRSSELEPGHPCCRLVVTDKLFGDAATLEKFLRAILRAERFGKENRKEAIDSIAKYVKLDRSLIEKAYLSPHLDQTSDPNLKGIAHFWNVMKDAELVAADSKVDVAKSVEVNFYKQALDKLAAENPNDPYWKKLQDDFQRRNVI